jgi:hypothetical protein
MRSLSSLLAVLVSCLPLTAAGQQRPDFSGEWTLDRQASALQGEMSAIESGVVRIQHREPSFGFSRTFVIKAQPIDGSFEIQTDGREVANSNRGLTSRSRMEWQGNSLLLTGLIDTPRGTVSNVVRYELLDGGRTLRAVEDVGGAAPSHHNVWMFTRR